MRRWLPWALVAFTFAALVAVAVAVANERSDAAKQRHALCVQIEKVKKAERTLWARAILRAPGNTPQSQIDAFKADLAELFPRHPCP